MVPFVERSHKAEDIVRNLATAISATVTAVIIALLIANVASSARAAEIANTKQQQLVALQDAANTNDVTMQLEAYRTRYAEAYAQLAAAYQVLYERDAAYRAALDQANATSAQLANVDASLEARLIDAYAALRDAQAVVAALRAGTTGATAAPGASSGGTPGTATSRPATPPPATATPRPATGTPRPTPTMYCWYDAEGKWVCEDHPRGQ